MKIVTLIENTPHSGLASEHGLSLYIETERYKILFDTGSSGAFADNAERLGIDLKQVDFVVLSHGHYDHGGGLARFAQINSAAPIYISDQAFAPHYNGVGKYIGLDGEVRNLDNIFPVLGHIRIGEGVELFPWNAVTERYPIDTCGMTVVEENCIKPDVFCHEQYLLIREAGKTVCFSGCSHRGIENIVSAFPADVLVGGFHFMKLAPEDPRIDRAAEVLLSNGGVYYTGHCTGQPQFDRLKERMGDRLTTISTGDVFVI